MTREELLQKALEDYSVYLQMYQPREWKGKLEVAQKCKECLDNGGIASRSWLLENSIILKEAIRASMHYIYQQMEDRNIQGQKSPELKEQHSALFDLLRLLK